MKSWQATVRSGRKILHSDPGVSLEFFSFRLQERVPWAEMLEEKFFYLCLNLGGRGVVSGDVDELFFERQSGGFFSLKGTLNAWRMPGEPHEFLLWSFRREFLLEHCAVDATVLREEVLVFLEGAPVGRRVGPGFQMEPAMVQMGWNLLRPTVPASARRLWYSSQALEFMSLLLYRRGPSATGIWRPQEVSARERVQAAASLISARLDQPWSLEDLAAEVGCSPFYLSRLFSRELGLTIPQYLRRVRMERAAQMFATGRFNVTEVALEVGYASVSHFSKAFAAEHGLTPSAFLRSASRRH